MLAETGCLSNPPNEALLNRPGLRAVIAGDIRDAISGYCGNQRALDAARA